MFVDGASAPMRSVGEGGSSVASVASAKRVRAVAWRIRRCSVCVICFFRHAGSRVWLAQHANCRLVESQNSTIPRLQYTVIGWHRLHQRCTLETRISALFKGLEHPCRWSDCRPSVPVHDRELRVKIAFVSKDECVVSRGRHRASLRDMRVRCFGTLS